MAPSPSPSPAPRARRRLQKQHGRPQLTSDSSSQAPVPAPAPTPEKGSQQPETADSGKAGESDTRAAQHVVEVALGGPPSPPSPHRHHRGETQMEAFRAEIKLLYLREQQLERRWAHEDAGEGVMLRTSKDHYICQPRDLPDRNGSFYEAMKKLNAKVAMTVKTPVIQLFLETYKLHHMPYHHAQRISIIDTIDGLTHNHRHHYAVFVRHPGILVVWDEDSDQIVERAVRIERHLVDMPWTPTFENEGDSQPEEQDTSMADVEKGSPKVVVEDEDLQFWDKPRPTMLWQPLVVGCAGCLTLFCLSIGWRELAVQIKIDHDWTRLLLVIVSPLQLWLGWFFFMTVITAVAQLAGPVKPLFRNSKFYSSVRTPRLQTNLPHVTIQCPVYKEGLEAVICPTVASLQQAISTYELQGGSANIFVNDDGMQLISPEEARKRVEFYEDNNIGWVARPKHAPKGDANGQNIFIRAGKFKKASNMNYCLNVSNRVEDIMATAHRTPNWTQEDEDQLYISAFHEIIKQDRGRTWGAGNIRIGDFILLVDSDTRVPNDCLLDAVSEMVATPEVAIIQFSSGVLNVTTSFFEMAITFFTNLIYTSIRFAVAYGDVAPFVGHNAMLRWAAVQDIRYKEDGIEKYWAENTVSEDFDMALRLQSLGYIIRYSTYFNNEFKEGVSLTVYDELIRWEKYAYGCAELIFHPFHKWPFRGPFTPLFRRFFFVSPISWMGKLTIMSYVGTYFAIGSAWMLTLLNYFLLGWFNGYLDKDYAESFNVYFGLVVIFQGAGTVSLAVLRYRSEGRSLFECLFENVRWMLVITVFLGGISLHVSGAIVYYLLGIDMSWGATAKEATTTSFFREIPVIIKKFKFTFIYCILSVAMVLALAGVGPLGALVPHDWRIKSFIAIFPQMMVAAMHFLLPLILNPGLMHFTF